jgi:hypothetical protein
LHWVQALKKVAEKAFLGRIAAVSNRRQHVRGLP